MGLPDLPAMVAAVQERLRLRDWQIAAEYVDDLRTRDGAEAYGLCYPFPDDRRAVLKIRTPQTPEDAARVPETVVHEMLHALLSPLAGSNVEPGSIAVEESIVWTLAPLLSPLAAGSTERAMLATPASRVRAERAIRDVLIKMYAQDLTPAEAQWARTLRAEQVVRYHREVVVPRKARAREVEAEVDRALGLHEPHRGAGVGLGAPVNGRRQLQTLTPAEARARAAAAVEQRGRLHPRTGR